jgi:protein SCO1
MRWFVALLLVGLLAACGSAQSPDFRGTDITGVDFGKHLELTDHHGQPRRLADFKGKLVVLFFGYTHCPDVCPTTLSDTASALRQLTPDEAARVQVLFVTVDPERDSVELLRQYVPYFNPTFLGLWGTPAQVSAAAKEFRVFYRKHQEPGVNGYTVDHTAGSYVLDAAGRLRLLLPFALPAEDMAHDLRLLLRAG